MRLAMSHRYLETPHKRNNARPTHRRPETVAVNICASWSHGSHDVSTPHGLSSSPGAGTQAFLSTVSTGATAATASVAKTSNLRAGQTA